MLEKVAKTGNIGEKKDYRLPSNSFVPLIHFFFFFFFLYPNNWGSSR